MSMTFLIKILFQIYLNILKFSFEEVPSSMQVAGAKSGLLTEFVFDINVL